MVRREVLSESLPRKAFTPPFLHSLEYTVETCAQVVQMMQDAKSQGKFSVREQEYLAEKYEREFTKLATEIRKFLDSLA